MKWTRRRQKGVSWLEAARLARYRWLQHGFTLRQPGELNLNYSVARTSRTVTRNRRALLRALRAGSQAAGWQLVTLRQRHTDLIQVIAHDSLRGTPASIGSRPLREPDGALKLIGDALITNQPGLLLAAQVADCLPIVLVDAEKRVVAVVHAGWRGTVKRLAEKTVGRMRQEFGCNPRKMLAVIGPGIHCCCYQVGREVVEAFESRFPYWEKLVRRTEPAPSQMHWQQRLFSTFPRHDRVEPRPRPPLTPRRGEKFHLDLVEANRRQLRAAGVQVGNIVASALCTASRADLFFSHRAERGRTGRMMGLIGIVPKDKISSA